MLSAQFPVGDSLLQEVLDDPLLALGRIDGDRSYYTALVYMLMHSP